MELQFLENTMVLENTLLEHIEAVIIFLFLFVLFITIKKLILYRVDQLAQKTETDIDDIIVHIFRSFKVIVFFVIALYISLQAIIIPADIQEMIYIIFFISIVYQCIQTLQVVFIEFVFQNFIRKKLGEDEKETMATGVIRTTVSFTLWVLGILLIAQNLGFNVTSLLAGLGIGGIAIALAMQNVLSDLFSSFSIIFDKSFEVGDFIIVDGKLGTVKSIGMKTTRIEALHGEEIVMSNKEITSATIHNYKRMEKRRAVFQLNVPYETKNDKLEKIPEMIKEIIQGIENAEYNRAHLSQLDKSFVIFEVVYYVLTRNYTEYMNINEKILLGIKEQFEKEKIKFAHSTKTVFLQK